MTKPTNDEAFEARKAQIYAAAMEAAAKAYPLLTGQQCMKLAAHIADHGASKLFLTDGICAPDADWMATEFKYILERDQPELFRVAPSAAELVAALRAKDPNMSATDRVTLHRRVASLTTDERLAESEGLEIKAVKQEAETMTTDTRTAAEIEAGITREDKILLGKGYDVRNLPALKRQELRAMVAEVPTPMPHVDEVKVRMRGGAKFNAVPALVRVAAHREAQAAGKQLADLVPELKKVS